MILEYLAIFLGILLVSGVFGIIRFRLMVKSPIWYKIFHIFGFIGIMVHELSHYMMCLLTGVKVEKAGIIPERDEKGGLHGYISPGDSSFLQTILISFAPLVIGTYLIAFLLQFVLIVYINILLVILSFFLILSILIAISPSPQDIRTIFIAASDNKKYTAFQVALASICVFLSYFIMIFFNFLLFDYLITLFLFTMGTYYSFKYSGIGILALNRAIMSNIRNIKHTRYKTIKKRRYKEKLNFVPRAQW